VPSGPLSAPDRQRRAALLQLKLGALARDHFGPTDPRPVPFAGGAALVDAVTSTGWLLVDEPAVERDPMEPDSTLAVAPRGWMGGAALFAARQHLAVTHLLLEHVDGHDARRAALFAPELRLWRVDGRAVEAVAPTPFVELPPPAVDVLAFAGIIEAAGADAVVEHGVLRAEVLGLEVGRVIADADGGPMLEVGVGRHDRLAHAMMHPDVPVGDALRQTVEAVRLHRRPGAASHPANQLAPERWLRELVIARPALVGAAVLEPAVATEPARFRRPAPAIAIGRDERGGPVVVACTTGVDLDAAAFAADAFAALGVPDAALLLVLPEGDDLPAVRELAAALRHPARIVTVPRDWRDLTPVA
jgi:hypothetical protein